MSGVPSAFILLPVAVEVDDTVADLVAMFFEPTGAVEPITPVFDVVVCVVVAGVCDVLVVIFVELTVIVPAAGAAVWAWAALPIMLSERRKPRRRFMG